MRQTASQIHSRQYVKYGVLIVFYLFSPVVPVQIEKFRSRSYLFSPNHMIYCVGAVVCVHTLVGASKQASKRLFRTLGSCVDVFDVIRLNSLMLACVGEAQRDPVRSQSGSCRAWTVSRGVRLRVAL